MTQTTARIKQTGKNFEIIVNLESALKFREGKASVSDFLEIDSVFTDSKKGFHASETDLKKAFGTSDINSIAEKIVRSGEILTTQEYRDEGREKKVKQVVDFLSRNSIDPQTGRPHTPERIKNALEQSHVSIKNSPVESQINEIVEALSKIIPIKITTRKVRIIIPAIHTGKVYGLINPHKENENWLSNGDLEVTVNVPAGIVIDFYDKLNSATHGSVITEEVKE